MDGYVFNLCDGVLINMMNNPPTMLPQCVEKFNNFEKGIDRIERDHKEEHSELVSMLKNHGEKLSGLGEDIAFIKGKMKGNNPGNSGGNNPGNNPGNSGANNPGNNPGNPGANNPGNNPGNPGDVDSGGFFTIKWSNLSGLTRSIVKILSAIGSFLVIIGGSKITGII